MLHTIVPIEDVLATEVPPPLYGEVAVDGRCMVVTFTPEGPPRLVRLISTNPFDYLDARLQPGAVLDWVFPGGVL